MSDLTLEDLLVEAGSARPRVEQIIHEVALGLLEARIVVDTEKWRRVSANDAFVKEFLDSTVGVPVRTWDRETLLGGMALDTVRQINRRAHAWSTTRGAARYRAAVIRAQGGEFCSMCGRRETLVVDHIIPVSVGGDETAVANMQLLCHECNLGKGNLRDRLLPAAISLRVTRAISPSLRFKHLLLDSVLVDGRNRGVCSCAARADVTELRVVLGSPAAAANLLTLTTRCRDCLET